MFTLSSVNAALDQYKAFHKLPPDAMVTQEMVANTSAGLCGFAKNSGDPGILAPAPAEAPAEAEATFNATGPSRRGAGEEAGPRREREQAGAAEGARRWALESPWSPGLKLNMRHLNPNKGLGTSTALQRHHALILCGRAACAFPRREGFDRRAGTSASRLSRTQSRHGADHR